MARSKMWLPDGEGKKLLVFAELAEDAGSGLWLVKLAVLLLACKQSLHTWSFVLPLSGEGRGPPWRILRSRTSACSVPGEPSQVGPG